MLGLLLLFVALPITELIVLIRLGQRPLADELDRTGRVFRLSNEFDESVPFGYRHFDEGLARLLSTLIPHRSCFGPPLHRRIIRVTVRVRPEIREEPCSSPLLDKIAAGYNGYRRQLVQSVATGAPTVLEEHPWLLEGISGDVIGEAFSGFSKTAADGSTAKALLSVLPILYLLSAHIGATKEREMEGKPVGFLSKILADNPTLHTMLAAGALKHLAHG